MGDKEDSKDENLNNAVDGSADSVSLDREGPNPQQKSSYMLERDQRGAVIHTVDVSRTRSESARQMIKGFRHGMYSDAIEFHVGEVSEWIETQFIERDSERSPFLSHVILDLPSTSGNVETAASALKVNGSLVAFNPSITQIMSIVSVIKEKFLPLQLERVIELGQNMTGGREWDVRAVKPRAITRAQNEVASHTTESEDMAHAPATSDNRLFDVESTETDRQAGGESKTLSIEDKSWEMVCRPKVGERVVGGGFLGVSISSPFLLPNFEHKLNWPTCFGRFRLSKNVLSLFPCPDRVC